MSIVLEKRAEKIGIILAKAGIVKVPPVRVGLALDVSGSAQGLYTGGIIQKTVDRLIPVAMKFDDNGELDMWSFANGFDRLENASASDEGSYVQEQILENDEITLWQGTEYGPVLNDMINFWFPKTSTVQQVVEETTGFFGKLFGKKVEAAPVAQTATHDSHGQSVALPAMGILITDGENSDRAYAAQVLKASQNVNVYWQLVGVGKSSFNFLEQQADLLPNVGFVNLHSLDISDDDLYNALIAPEFLEWVKTRAQA
jgi:hypothetical protein